MSRPKNPDSNPPVINIKEYKPKFITQYNPETGEFEWFSQIISKKRITGSGWTAMYQSSATWLAKLHLTGEQASVLWALIGLLDFNNYVRVSQIDLAKELGFKQQNVSRSIKKLIELNIICEGPRAGLCKTYILNPNIGMKGRQKQQKIIDYEEQKLARAKEKRTKTRKPQTEADNC